MTDSRQLPPPPARIHFVGIGGIGMSGLARILHAWGYRVTGSDSASSDQTGFLQAEGIDVAIGHGDATNAAASDLVVMTAAVAATNAEVLVATSRGIPVVKRAELLGMLANARYGVAVAGSHGKSTTSGMLVSALRALGRDPSFAVGAIVATERTNAAPGSGEIMVVEADEYDRSFLWLRPRVAIVTNIDYDHPDIFADQAEYDGAFDAFVRKIQPGGTLVLSADDAGCRSLLARLGSNRTVRIVRFGEGVSADWRIDGNVVLDQAGDEHVLNLSVPGRHNIANGTAALAALVALGIDPETGVTALGTFRGVDRRFEIKGEHNGIVVVDDYAHHPSEIRVTLATARERFPGRRVWAVFQPHTYSRTKALLADFAASLSAADEVILLDIYPSRETDSLGMASDQLVDLIGNGRLGGSIEQTIETLGHWVLPGDVVITMGAGDVTSVGPQLLRRLASRHHAVLAP